MLFEKLLANGQLASYVPAGRHEPGLRRPADDMLQISGSSGASWMSGDQAGNGSATHDAVPACREPGPRHTARLSRTGAGSRAVSTQPAAADAAGDGVVESILDGGGSR